MEQTSTPNKKRLIDELIKGRDSTKKLQNLLQRRVVDDGSVSTKDLVMNIVGSFSNSILELSSCGSGGLSPAATTYVGSACSAEPTWELGEPDVKPMPAVIKNRRGCYKRRKKEDSRVKIVDTIEDEFAWRKYGQKEVLNSKFPRRNC
ncbi:hypothetical protein M8C21_007780 [Ambrosia artemisiifolia]|uniref:WRKY domain-containing protein n=1 Tax=Ambrosia artemisiifolia TaxID=4212 RepID=A0AAD5BVS1_AMBAR|nr:hypothetical protein M8C21_007780 [Ambrosia artemisiifolia]